MEPPDFGARVSPVSGALREAAPEATQNLDALIEVAWKSADPVELELCRLRIASMLGDTVGSARRTVAATAAGLDEQRIALLDRWWESPAFSPRERARLAYTEQFVTSVSSMGDEEIEALLAEDDHVQVYEFTMAIYVLEMTTRADMMIRAVLGPPLDPGDPS